MPGPPSVVYPLVPALQPEHAGTVSSALGRVATALLHEILHHKIIDVAQYFPLPGV